jgi:signal transduction histidine kinase
MPGGARAPAVAPALPVALRSRSALERLRTLLDSLRVLVSILSILLVLDRDAADRRPMLLVAMGFGVYAGLLHAARLRRVRFVDSSLWIWIDAAWCLALFAITGGGRDFLVLLFLPLLFSAIRTGALQSLQLSFACAAVVASLLLWQRSPAPLWQVFLLPAALLLTGPLAAIIARRESQSQERYAFAAELAQDLGGRQGVEAIARSALGEMSARLGADVALLALQSAQREARVFLLENRQPASELSGAAAARLAQRLFCLPADEILAVRPTDRFLHPLRRPFMRLDLQGNTRQRLRSLPEEVAAIGALLQQDCLLLVPAGQRGTVRLSLVLGRDHRPFEAPQAQAARYVLEHLVPLVDNALLLERLMGAAADVERARIGRDLHDSAVQPYIGLKLAIEALLHRVPPEQALHADVARLLEMADEELQSMREVVSGLRNGGNGEGLLAAAVRRQVERFSELFGISVDLQISGQMPASRRLAGEVFHLVAEGLSNISRHTNARHAGVCLQAQAEDLQLTIRNECDAGAAPRRPFQPRSLSERVAELGGRIEVHFEPRATEVRIAIPLPRPRAR